MQTALFGHEERSLDQDSVLCVHLHITDFVKQNTLEISERIFTVVAIPLECQPDRRKRNLVMLPIAGADALTNFEDR